MCTRVRVIYTYTRAYNYVTKSPRALLIIDKHTEIARDGFLEGYQDIPGIAPTLASQCGHCMRSYTSQFIVHGIVM